MYQDIVDRKKKIAVVGLGYVGLPIALEFAKTVDVIGFDINTKRVEMMKNRQDPSYEVDASEFDNRSIEFTDDIEKLKEASFYIVAVPTPVDEHKVPNLTPVLSASRTIGNVISEGDYVVYESTVYPGCTEEDCIPIVEELSGLKDKVGFKSGYSPERINPGDKVHTLTNTVKIVSGCDEESLEEIAKVYELVIEAGVHRATSIKVAEAAKIVENSQRDLNISLMNELSIIFKEMDVNTYDVIEAAGTKWNFLKFYPGLVGGHCIGVDPYYLTYKAEQLGVKSKVILSGRIINDEMPAYVAKKVTQEIIKTGVPIAKARVLVMGTTFKENVADIRNSKVVELIKELEGYSLHLDIVDPYAVPEEMEEEYGIKLNEEIGDNYNFIIVAVGHKQYRDHTEDFYQNRLTDKGVLFDVKGLYRGEMKDINYWSL
jgi:UDP-N-acetyl-D-galactosamine dehydrogenase